MALMTEEEITAQRTQILRDLFIDRISSQSAAQQLVASLLSENVSLDGCLGPLWNLIIGFSRESTKEHGKLVNILVHLCKRPDAQDDEGGTLIIHGMTVWRDLPMLGWAFREELDTIMESSIPREQAVAEFTNFYRFLALLMATEESVFNYSWFALVALRTALETPIGRLYSFPADTAEPWIRAASAWIEIMGAHIFEWDEEFERGPGLGARGRGGPLWNGKHGFCTDRWRLWRHRFAEIAAMEEEENEETRTVAKEAEIMMKEIESGEVDYGELELSSTKQKSPV